MDTTPTPDVDHRTEYTEELARMHAEGTMFARRLAYVSAVAFVVLSIITGWALYGRFEQTNGKRSEQAAINARFNAAAKTDCLEIEQLKTNVREAAITNLNSLDKNAKLLGITVTPALREQEAIDTAKVLRTYAARPCPHPSPEVKQ